MSSGGFRSCVCIPRAELAARRDVEYATNPAIAYEPLLGVVFIQTVFLEILQFYLFVQFCFVLNNRQSFRLSLTYFYFLLLEQL